jgi:ferritin-like metal-binding protein YciE
MAEPNARESKLIQYLGEAYGTEKQLETALEAHIQMATRAAYRKRLQQHLTETRRHGREVERRIKQLGGAPLTAEAIGRLQEVAGRALAAAQGPLHAVRGTGEAERQLKNAKTEYASEAQEIAIYSAIETLAAAVGDRETERLARSIRREEERMASFLERQIPTLTKAVVTAEIPAAQRNGGRRRRRSSSSRRTSARRSSPASRSTSAGRSSPASRTRSRASSRRTSARTRAGGSSRRSR